MTFDEYKKSKEGTDLLTKLKRKLKIRGFNTTDFQDDDLFDEIESAIEAVNERRHFTSTEQKLFEDKYKEIVVRLCICSIAKMGAEGQLSHSENGISRTYAGASELPNDILKEIVPLARIKEL